jgi:hypothetical protein
LDHRRNTVITNELTNFMEQSPFWETDSSLASLEITFSGNGRLIAETHPVHVLPPFLVKLHFNIILHCTSGSSKWPLSLSFPNQNPVCTSSLPHSATCLAHLILFCLMTRITFVVVYQSPRRLYAVSSNLLLRFRCEKDRQSKTRGKIKAMVGENVVKMVYRPVLVYELLKEAFSLAYYLNMSSYVQEKLRERSGSLYCSEWR